MTRDDAMTGAGVPPVGGIPPSVQNAILEAPLVRCKCGCATFTEAMMYKEVPGLYFGQTEPKLIPAPVTICTHCGQIMPSLINSHEFKKFVGKEYQSFCDEAGVVVQEEQKTPENQRIIKLITE